MTPEDIDKLEAGRDLDILILTTVFGLEPQQCMVGGHPPGCTGNTSYPPYSTDIAAAWEVVEKLDLLYRNRALMRTWGGYGVYPQIRDAAGATVLDICHPIAKADTAPLAICRAALKAISAHKQLRNRQLTELYFNSLTRRGKEILTQQTIDELEAHEQGNDTTPEPSD